MPRINEARLEVLDGSGQRIGVSEDCSVVPNGEAASTRFGWMTHHELRVPDGREAHAVVVYERHSDVQMFASLLVGRPFVGGQTVLIPAVKSASVRQRQEKRSTTGNRFGLSFGTRNTRCSRRA